MFQKLNSSEVEALMGNKSIGYYGLIGSVIPAGCQQVIVEARTGTYLIPIDEFRHNAEQPQSLVDCGVSLSKRAWLAVGGLPRSEEELLAEELSVSVACALDVLYLRTRSRWSAELEQELIQAHQNNVPVNIYEFGSTATTQANLYWSSLTPSDNG